MKPNTKNASGGHHWSTLICCDLTADRVSIGWRPLFSASAIGIESKASANARIAYCKTIQNDNSLTMTNERIWKVLLMSMKRKKRVCTSLLNTGVFISSGLHSNWTRDLSRTTTIYYRIIADKVPGHTQSIMNAPLCFLYHHLVTLNIKSFQKNWVRFLHMNHRKSSKLICAVKR